MINIHKILFPTDLSETAAEAQKYACAMAQEFNAELHLLSVVQDMTMVSPDPYAQFVVPASSLAEARHSVEEALLKLPDPAWEPPKRIVRCVKSGSPDLEIVRYAREHSIDLIVLGSHGRSGLAHLLLGSTAERVTRTAPCPVLTVRPEGRQFVHP